MKTAPDVLLTEDERKSLKKLISTGKSAARVQTRARTLLLAAERSAGHSRGGDRRRSNSNDQIAGVLQVSARTVSRTRQRYVSEGLEAALHDQPRAGRPREITGDVEAKLTMLACSEPPDGRDHWTLQLLANKMVELDYIDHISDVAVMKVLKANELRPWAVKSWCIPKVTTRFVAKMEDVLDVYQRPYDPKRPQICLDEKPKALQADLPDSPPEPAVPGQPGREVVRQDYEYDPQGVANIFLAVEPLRGVYWAGVSPDRTAATFARHLKTLVDEIYATAERLVLTTDNLNTHGPWSLYEVFPPAEAKRIADKIEWHYTPEHGSWLNIAEIGLSILQRQCLKRRFPDQGRLSEEVQAWVAQRNQAPVKINWQFTTADARIKLRHLYPVLE